MSKPCLHDKGTWFDRVLCEEPCGSMHDRCNRCSAAVNGCILEDHWKQSKCEDDCFCNQEM